MNLEKFSSQKIKFPGISPKSQQKVVLNGELQDQTSKHVSLKIKTPKWPNFEMFLKIVIFLILLHCLNWSENRPKGWNKSKTVINQRPSFQLAYKIKVDT